MERSNHIEARQLPPRTLRESSMQELPPEVTTPCGLGTSELSEKTASSAMLLKEREAVTMLLRKNFDEYTKMTDNDDTADYLVTGLLQAQNRTLWMLRRYLP